MRTTTPHICFLQDTLYDPSGGGIWTGVHLQTYLLAKHFREAGLRVSFLLPTWLDHSVPAIYDGMTVRTVTIHERVPFLRDWGTAMAELKKLRPDFVYTRGRSWMTALAGAYARDNDARSIWASCNEDGCKHWKYVEKAIASKAPLPKRLRRLSAGFLEDLVYAWGIRRADDIVNQTERQRESLMQEFGRRGTVIRSIQEVPIVPPTKATPLTVIWIGWLDIVKRPELFFQLAADCRDLPIEFRMIGGTPVGYDLESQLAKASVNPRFNYLGRLSREETMEEIGRASLIVNTSSPGGDGIPNVMIESWMRYVPALTCQFDPGGLIRQYGLGTVTNSYEELVGEFRRLVSDTERIDSLARRCHDVAVDLFSGERVMTSYMKHVLRVTPVADPAAVTDAGGVQ